MRTLLIAVSVFLAPGGAALAQTLVRGNQDAPHRGVYEVVLQSTQNVTNPYVDASVEVTFTRPNGSTVRVDGFFDGGSTWRARAYAGATGTWTWRSTSSTSGLGGKTGSFRVVSSSLKGKLRVHPNDRRQFAYDNGEWFLHIGDTGYRYVVDSEPEWKEYLDQAVQMGATKIRTWFAKSRHTVEALFASGRSRMNLSYWQEIERRVRYGLDAHPDVMFQLIPFGEDTAELLRYDSGDAASRRMAAYAQARFSSFPNVTWCVSNDRHISTDANNRRAVDKIGTDMAAREPWGTLLTNHQRRFSGYSYVDAPWSDVITLEDQGQVDGAILLEYRNRGNDPVVNDEDRYEHHRNPAHDRYFFRRLMWGSLLSGGMATYGGARTWEAYDNDIRGVQGYYDLNNAGKLQRGGHDFKHIHTFFRESGLALAGMTPSDSRVGNNPSRFKCISNSNAVIAYLANPSGSNEQTDNESGSTPSVTVQLAAGTWRPRWFNPSTGAWTDRAAVQGGSPTLSAPGAGDWVLLLTPQTSNQPPSATVTAPADGATFVEGDSIPLQATASDPDGSVARVEFRVDGTVVGQDGTAPYSYTWNNVAAGTYTITARAVDDAGAASVSPSITIVVTSTGGGGGAVPVIDRLVLYDADTDLPIAGFDPLGDGAVLNLATLPTRNLSIQAFTSPSTVGSVRFELDGDPAYQVESVAPYAIAGDASGDLNPWTPSLGAHSLRATAYTESGGNGSPGPSVTIGFTVVDDPGAGGGSGGGGASQPVGKEGSNGSRGINDDCALGSLPPSGASLFWFAAALALLIGAWRSRIT